MTGFSSRGSRQYLSFIVLVLFLNVLSGCTTIALYSEAAYEQATSLKVESLALMGKATGTYIDHQGEVEALKTKLQKAYEYAKGRPKNEVTVKQWEILLNPERNLLGGFLKRWEEQSTLSGVFIDEAKGLVADAFDTIIGLESGKIKPKEMEGR